MFKLIAFQNIHVALDENETLAWKKLLSVMTHEIVNSVAPISSLAETMKNRLNNRKPGEKQDDALFNDLELGIETIERRSKGLQKFAETYRALNKIATPDLQKVYLRDIFENIYRLMQPTFDHKGIQFEMILKETSLYIEVDMHLIEQVLINLIVNAIEAVKESPQPTIRMYAYSNTREKAIRITDNGSGMPEEILEKIFIPFFTTRKNGSGIGLSLCKQIMLLHQGKINARSRVGEGTAMTLVFI
jgi:signal transduction histidine kinase